MSEKEVAQLAAKLAADVRAAIQQLAPITVKTVDPATANARNSLDKAFVERIVSGAHLKGDRFLNGA